MPPGVSLVHFVVWKYVLIELTKMGTESHIFSQDTVLKSASKRLERRLKTAEVERLKALQRANARGEVPNFDKIKKWLRGIGDITDGKITLKKEVTEFLNSYEE